MPPDPPPPWLMRQRRQVGHRIRDLREAAELTQEQLAYRAEISRDSVLRTENATHSPSLDVLARIARALGTDVGSLFN
ncbi:helix-turn-helix transcriptional regulator [Streptomyces sp. NPDC088733]|uniref:helix-turn-helix transcriptional regulator n=1 Tax=Streptomyces sp. NPDC088733 TaxID=3365880 RepID=UPI003810BB9E